jgi:EEF1A N-terminal glycine/lysine methyltransferase
MGNCFIPINLADIFILLVIELGAGCGLPSLLSATITNPPHLVVVTDYPDEVILGNLRRNMQRNDTMFKESGCLVRCSGYKWGESTEELM